MTAAQFEALSTLMRLLDRPARDGLRMHFVDAVSIPDAARAVGVEYNLLHRAAQRVKAAHALACVAAGFTPAGAALQSGARALCAG